MIFQHNTQHKKNPLYFFVLLFLMHMSCVQTNSWRNWIPTTFDKKTVAYGAVGLALLYVGVQLLSGFKSSSEPQYTQNGGRFGGPSHRHSYSSQQKNNNGNDSLGMQLAMVVLTAAIGSSVYGVFSQQDNGAEWSGDSEFKCIINVATDDLVGLSKNFEKIQYQAEQANPILPPMLILHGPPGTGKSLRAKVIAAARGGEHLELKFSHTESTFTGFGVNAVGRLFDEIIRLSQETTENITVIIDEIEGHLPIRDKLEGGSVANDQMKRVNAFIVGIDSLNNTDLRGRVLLIGTTNNISNIDGTLSNRPDRCKTFEVSYPKEVEQRRDLLNHYFKKHCLAEKICLPNEKKIEELAEKLGGNTADHIRDCACKSVNEAVEQNKTCVTDAILEKIIKDLNEEQKKLKSDKSGLPNWDSISVESHDWVIAQGGAGAVCNDFNRGATAIGHIGNGLSTFYSWFKSNPKKTNDNA